MKRILALIILCALFLPLVSCSGRLATETTEETATEEQQKTEEEKETGPITYPDGFSVGYATVDITGQQPIVYYGGVATSAHDPLLLTCVAMCDGENVALVMTADLKKMYDNVANKSLEIIEKKFGIPASNVIISCTHSHSAPDAGEDVDGNVRWQQQYYQKLPLVVEDALRDLDVVEGAYTGKSNIEEGVTFVRRYLLEDGTYKFAPAASDRPVAHESEADPEFRTIRFDRKNKKDVLMVNFQTHYGNADIAYPNQLSADFVYPFRTQAAEKFDALIAYYSGASGNIAFSSAIDGERKYSSFITAVEKAFIPATAAALEKEEKIELGNVHAERSLFTATCMIRTEERIAQAKAINAAGGPTDPDGAKLMKEYDFESELEIMHTLRHANLPETMEVPFNAISFGDLSFVSSPYEMFDTNGKQIRDASPFKTTFICTLAGGALGYVPSALGYENGSYETWNCAFIPGSGEVFANELIRLLNICRSEN